MSDLDGLKLALCQMPVRPGRLDVNAKYIIQEIYKAKERGADIAVFPEMSVSGYLIGDLFEDDSFVRDVIFWNEKIREATFCGITAIFGSLQINEHKKGEDGRIRKFNSGLIAQNGKWVGITVKSLQPNYRVFDDDRHFYSLRKICERKNFEANVSKEYFMPRHFYFDDFLRVFSLRVNDRKVKAGVILCEDMWHDDYAVNPAKILAEKGAEIIFNLSASPWTWQKNRKRHKVVRELLHECGVCFVYVNNTGIQNNGKNIVIFDGSSTVYNCKGDIIFDIKPYVKGTKDFVLACGAPQVEKAEQDDTEQLYTALSCAIKEFFSGPQSRIVIGLSGGIDSAFSASLFVDALGKDNVVAINMPSKFSSDETRSLAQQIALNLGVKYEIRPIQKIVDLIAETSDVRENSLVYENIQARVRMEILAALSQEMRGFFICNSNKVEIAFGYGTLYGDIAGSFAPLGDLVKREIYQLADYMNRIVFGREIIPKRCFEQAPSAELKKNQKDPFDYGNIARRGYHDELVRAFTEFRRGPEWVIKKYMKHELEAEFLLEPGTVKNLFSGISEFITDLEKCWERFYRSYFKRVQAPPIPIVSKRAFGFDLRESMIEPHYTEEYRDCVEKLFCSVKEY